MDADTVNAVNTHEVILNRFRQENIPVLVGTQMVAKGLDFPNVTLVGVLGADNAMFSEDFRSFERTFSLLTQVVGRAGRGETAGKAIIQTADPNSDLIAKAQNQDYDSFYEDEILSRKLRIFPPYCDICVVSVRSVSREKAEKSINLNLEEFKKELEKDSIPPLTKMMLLEPQMTAKDMQSIQCPALITAGENDLIDPEHTKLIANNIPSGEMYIVPNEDHGSFVYKSPIIGKIVLDYLKKIDY